MKKTYFLLSLMFFVAISIMAQSEKESEVELIILGTIQDAGSPHIACTRECCKDLIDKPDNTRRVVSLGLIDYENEEIYLFEASPDFDHQLSHLIEYSGFNDKIVPDGIFLTHAHIGHYTGLMYLGREALGAKSANVYCMPRMKTFLEKNGPWSQLVGLKNIHLKQLENEKNIDLNNNISVIPFKVPHRDEFSETVGYKIIGAEKTALFIPDINKWNTWDKSLAEELKSVDYAFIDGSFYNLEEISYRNVKEIPHPTMEESMDILKDLPKLEKSKVYFIHFNHTNPILKDAGIRDEVKTKGFNISRFAQVFQL